MSSPRSVGRPPLRIASAGRAGKADDTRGGESHFDDDRAAAAYAKHVAPCFSVVHDYVCDYVASLDTPRVADVGCGDGMLTARLPPLGTSEVVGIDSSQPLLRLAAARSNAVRWMVADAHQLPLGSGCFDLAICCLALSLMRDPATALSELRRIASEILVVVLLAADRERSDSNQVDGRSARFSALFSELGLQVAHKRRLTNQLAVTNPEVLAGILGGEVGPWAAIETDEAGLKELAPLILARMNGRLALELVFDAWHLRRDEPTASGAC
jgi:SAM-dependent methyltransferase